MILVDTSIWVDHLSRAPDARLSELLARWQVLSHPFVVGELALGHLRRRAILNELGDLPQAVTATDAEVLATIERHSLAGKGIGYVDAHLFAAVQLTEGAALWTRDKRLSAAAARLGLAAEP